MMPSLRVSLQLSTLTCQVNPQADHKNHSFFCNPLVVKVTKSVNLKLSIRAITTTAAEIMYEYLLQPANESNTERLTHVNDSDVEESADPGILQHNSADESDVPVNEDNQLFQLQLQLQSGELVVELNEEEELAFINETELTVAFSTFTETRLVLTQQNLYEVHSQTMNNPDCQNVIVEFNGQNYELLLHNPTSARDQREDAVFVTDANNLYTEGEQHQEEGPVHQQWKKHVVENEKEIRKHGNVTNVRY
jgi:hypothetical protein